MVYGNVSLSIPDIDANSAHHAAAQFLAAIISADWSSGLSIQVDYEDDNGKCQSEMIVLNGDEVESILR